MTNVELARACALDDELPFAVLARFVAAGGPEAGRKTDNQAIAQAAMQVEQSSHQQQARGEAVIVHTVDVANPAGTKIGKDAASGPTEWGSYRDSDRPMGTAFTKTDGSGGRSDTVSDSMKYGSDLGGGFAIAKVAMKLELPVLTFKMRATGNDTPRVIELAFDMPELHLKKTVGAYVAEYQKMGPDAFALKVKNLINFKWVWGPHALKSPAVTAQVAPAASQGQGLELKLKLPVMGLKDAQVGRERFVELDLAFSAADLKKSVGDYLAQYQKQAATSAAVEPKKPFPIKETTRRG